MLAVCYTIQRCGDVAYQGMEGGHGEDAETTHGQFGGTGSESQQAFGVGKFAALQAGQVTAEAKQVHVELLQVLLPQEDLGGEKEAMKRRKKNSECV